MKLKQRNRKRVVWILVAAMLVVSCVSGYGLQVKAAVLKEGDYSYTVNDDGKSVTIKDYNGSGGDITIPSEIDGKKVTNIGTQAFWCCYNVTGITIPDGVAAIGDYAFQSCTNLAAVNIPDSVTSIGQHAFMACFSLPSIHIPKGVTYIAAVHGLAENCHSLASITVDQDNSKYDSRDNCNAIIETASNKLVVGCKDTVIPDSVTSIGNAAFYGCKTLTSINIPDSVTSIGDSAFCFSSLIGVNIPDSVTSIGDSAFHSTRLTDMSIPDSVKSIGICAFQDCNRLTRISVPDSVESIEMRAFSTANSEFVVYGEAGSAAEKRVEEDKDRFQDDTKFEAIPENDIRWAVTALEHVGYVYDGTAKTPSVTLEMNHKTLALNTDYTISYTDNTEVGTAKIIVTGMGDYQGSMEVAFSIWKDISEAEIDWDGEQFDITGVGDVPSATVTLDGKKLEYEKEYLITHTYNVNTGISVVTVIGMDSYTGSATKTFTKGTGSESTEKPTENPTEPPVETPTQNPEGTTTATPTGTPTATPEGTPTATPEGTPTVNPPKSPASSISCKKTVYKVAYGAKPFTVNATSAGKLTFTSSDPKIASVDGNTGIVTVKGTGVATITVKAGTNTVKVTVKVSPKKTLLKSVKVPKGKKLTVKWAKDKNASGYQVQASTTKNFKKNIKQKNVKKASYTFKKLKTGKKYYVRVRSYKKSGKETLYGRWSKTLKKKVK